MEKNIVALDLGTSKFALLAAKVLGDNVQVEYYREVPAKGMKYGRIFNTKNAGEALAPLLKDAEDKLGYKITSVVVGLPKYPIASASGTSETTDREFDTEITEEEISNLKRFAKDSFVLENDNQQIFEAVAQSFDTDDEFQVMEDEIVGITTTKVKGNIKLFVGSKSDFNNIDILLRKFDIIALRKYFTPVGIGKVTLNDSEAKGGVALVDFGAGCTSVSIFKDKVLRYYNSFPFGAQSITNDIEKECGIGSEIAENIKLAYGACMQEKLQNMKNKTLRILGIENNKTVTMKYLSEIISAREEEIIMAVLYLIYSSGFGDSITSIVGTGGGANLTNLGMFITKISGCQFRIGRPNVQYATPDNEVISFTTANGAIGLLHMAMEEDKLDCGRGVLEENVNDNTENIEEEERETLFGENEGFEVVDEKKEKKKKHKEEKKSPRINLVSKITEGVSNLFDFGYNLTKDNK